MVEAFGADGMRRLAGAWAIFDHCPALLGSDASAPGTAGDERHCGPLPPKHPFRYPIAENATTQATREAMQMTAAMSTTDR
jgi:hypothetical protein